MGRRQHLVSLLIKELRPQKQVKIIVLITTKMQPLHHHGSFFSSLRQVEKRLKSEDLSRLSSSPSLPPPPPPPPPSLRPLDYDHGSTGPTASLSSPLYLDSERHISNMNSILQESEPPQAFLSESFPFPLTQQDPSRSGALHPHSKADEVEDEPIEDMERLIQLLGLSEERREEEKRVSSSLGGGCGGSDSCHCQGGFYEKIVGFKGPKCGKEVERLEGWIKYFTSGGDGEKKEPLRLAHLLLGKAALACGDFDEFGRLEFPPTVQEFMQNDPPT